MATAELNAHEVNIACHAALIGNDPVAARNADQEHDAKRTRLRRLADLSSYVAQMTQNAGTIHLNEDDFFLISAHTREAGKIHKAPQ